MEEMFLGIFCFCFLHLGLEISLVSPSFHYWLWYLMARPPLDSWQNKKKREKMSLSATKVIGQHGYAMLNVIKTDITCSGFF